MRRRDLVLGFSLAAAFRPAWAEQSPKIHHIVLVDPVTLKRPLILPGESSEEVRDKSLKC